MSLPARSMELATKVRVHYQQNSYVTCANKLAETDIRFARTNQHCTNDNYSLITAVTITSGNLDQSAFHKNFHSHLEFHSKPGNSRTHIT
jgi:hypothetical protein